MAPPDMQTPAAPAQAHVAAEQPPSPIQTQQPKALQAMDPKAPQQDSGLGLRGGDGGGCCCICGIPIPFCC